MKERLNLIFKVIPPCESFADIGCDHGLMTKAMLESGKCKSAVISDISKNCLSKAEALLAEYIRQGIVKSYVSNGFENLPKVDLALIAGMGGEEIISILNAEKNLPEKLVLQPMKNADKLRRNLLFLGYKLKRDFTFKAENKFYDIILCEKGQDKLTEDEIIFGRDNLIEKGEAFIERLNLAKMNSLEYLKNQLSDEARAKILADLEKIERCLK